MCWGWHRGRAAGARARKAVPPDQTNVETYRIATIRMLKVFRAARDSASVSAGTVLGSSWRCQTGRARTGLLLAIILAAAAVALVRLHAISGYCTVRHGIVPGIILTLAAAYGLAWIMEKISIPGRWLGLAA